jgi:hypothetical protein
MAPCRWPRKAEICRRFTTCCLSLYLFIIVSNYSAVVGICMVTWKQHVYYEVHDMSQPSQVESMISVILSNFSIRQESCSPAYNIVWHFSIGYFMTDTPVAEMVLKILVCVKWSPTLHSFVKICLDSMCSIVKTYQSSGLQRLGTADMTQGLIV